MTNQEHIDHLLLNHNIRRIDAKELWRLCDNKEEAQDIIEEGCFAANLDIADQPLIFIGREVDDWYGYAAALHEIGHCVCDHRGRKEASRDEVLKNEQAAWEWAFENARCDITNECAWIMMTAMLTYWDNYYRAEAYEKLMNRLAVLLGKPYLKFETSV